MASKKHHARTKIKLLQKTFPSNLVKETTYNPRVSKPSPSMMVEAQAHDRRSPNPSPNTSSSFSSSPTHRRFGPTKHHWMSLFVITFE